MQFSDQEGRWFCPRRVQCARPAAARREAGTFLVTTKELLIGARQGTLAVEWRRSGPILSARGSHQFKGELHCHSHRSPHFPSVVQLLRSAAGRPTSHLHALEEVMLFTAANSSLGLSTCQYSMTCLLLNDHAHGISKHLLHRSRWQCVSRLEDAYQTFST